MVNLQGGKGDGPADASKVKAYGPGVEKGKVQPGVPANFKIDSGKTGAGSIDVDILGRLNYNSLTSFYMRKFLFLLL